MAAVDDAIEAPGRDLRARISLGAGGPLAPYAELVESVNFSQVIDSMPESVSQIAGTAASSASIQLRQSAVVAGETIRAHDLSPFRTGARSTRLLSGYGADTPVTITERVQVPGAAPVDYLAFTGSVTDFALDDDGGATLSCVDVATTLQGTATLSAAAGSQVTAAGGDSRINPIAVVDLCLRAAGRPLTPPTRSRALLSVPGIGSAIPELGDFIYSRNTSRGYGPSPWPAVIGSVDYTGPNAAQTTSPPPTAVGTGFLMEGWIQGQRPSSGNRALLNGKHPDNAFNTVTLGVTSAGVITYGVFGSAGSTTLTLPNDGAWHYLAVYTAIGSETAQIRLDGTTASLQVTTLSFEAKPLLVESVPCIGLQVSTPTASPETTGTWLNAWAPTQQASLDSVPQRCVSVAPQTAPSWQLIQEIARAYGDVAFFDRAGIFHYETRSVWRARRFASPARTVRGDRILSGAPSWGKGSVRSWVDCPVVVPRVSLSSASAPAWAATEIYTAAARTTVSFDVSLDYVVLRLQQVQLGLQTSASSSWAVAVRSAEVDNPSAEPVGNVRVTLRPTASGLTVTVVNGNAFPVALWTPGNGGSVAPGPYLVAHGYSVRVPEPRTVRVGTGAMATAETLELPLNAWRQDEAVAQEWVDDIAGEVALPQIVWPSLSLPFDPRLRIGDVLSIQDARYMDLVHAVQIVGLQADLGGGMHTMQLTVRSAYRATGWVMDVPGRTEMDTNTIMAV